MKIRREVWIVLFYVVLVPTLCSFGSSPAKWIEKTFSYDLDNEYWQYPPIEGLNVGFGSGEQLLWTRTTDASGQVHFGSGLVDGTYWLNWSWGGEDYWEEVTINCSRIVWELENFLPAKGGGAF